MPWQELEAAVDSLVDAALPAAEKYAAFSREESTAPVSEVWYSPTTPRVAMRASEPRPSGDHDILANKLAYALAAPVEVFGSDASLRRHDVRDWVKLADNRVFSRQDIVSDAEILPELLRRSPDTPPQVSVGSFWKTASAIASGRIASVQETPQARLQHHPAVKHAMDNNNTGWYIEEPIPVDYAKELVWETESGDPLPIPLSAATAALLESAHSDRTRRYGKTPGLRLVYPTDIARVSAGAGSGYLAGAVVGKVLGGLFGLAPETQNQLKQVGLWSGIISNTVPYALGERP